MVQHDFYAGPNARLFAPGQHSGHRENGGFGNAFSVSALAHAIGGVCLLLVASRLSPSHETVANFLKDVPRLAWIADSGSGGRGKNDAHPPEQLARQGRDAFTIPTNARADSRTLKDSTPQTFDIPVVSATSGIQELPGVPTGLAVVPGGGPGAGGRPGSGQGPGNGPGFGPGNGGLGDGYNVGFGVSAPRLIREVKPAYTSDAMRARIQGTVRLQAIVLPDGSVGNARVVRSLDDKFGLDEEALKAIKQWRFEPGRREERAVPVIIDIELSFALR